MKRDSFLLTLVKVVLVIVISLVTFFGTLGVLAVGVISVFAYVASKAPVDVLLSQRLEVTYGDSESSNVLLSVPVAGVILGNKSDLSDPLGILSESIVLGYDIKEQLYEAADDDDIKGIILEINSPGGTIYGSKAIADGVAYYKEKTHKPVLAFISGMGASGAYWVAASADSILADQGSIVGSIGVITGPFKYYDSVVAEDGGAFTGGVVTQRGIETTFISAGRSKDLGNPYRRLTPDEIAALQTMVNNDYNRFVSYVSSHRPIEESVIKEKLGALIFDTQSALGNTLIDKESNREEAYEELAKQANISGSDYKVVSQPEEAGFLKTILGSKLGVSGGTSNLCSLTKGSLVYYGSAFELCP